MSGIGFRPDGLEKGPQKLVNKKGTTVQVRIIGGKWKGRKLNITGNATLRPTPGRTRETLFNWLRADLAGSRCLDLFAGTGVLGLEALSQGAACSTWVERNPATVNALRQILNTLGVNNPSGVIKTDAQNWLTRGAKGAINPPPWDIIFLDPPYGQPQLLESVLSIIRQRQMANGYIYLEAPKGTDIQKLATSFELEVLRTTRAGDSHAVLLGTG